MARLFVRDLMTADPFTLTVDDTLAAVFDLMDQHHVRHVPIVDGDGDLVGLVTHRDLAAIARATDTSVPVSNRLEVLAEGRVDEVMSVEVETATPDQDLASAAAMMLENKFGCMPVVEGSRLVGILTESDFVRHLAEQLE
jgi:CBS domain-containing membrane protein